MTTPARTVRPYAVYTSDYHNPHHVNAYSWQDAFDQAKSEYGGKLVSVQAVKPDDATPSPDGVKDGEVAELLEWIQLMCGISARHPCVTCASSGRIPVGETKACPEPCEHARATVDKPSSVHWCPDCGAVKFGWGEEYSWLRPRRSVLEIMALRGETPRMPETDPCPICAHLADYVKTPQPDCARCGGSGRIPPSVAAGRKP